MRFPRFKILFQLGIVLLCAFIVFCNIYILSFGKNIISSVDEVKPAEVALIFGGGMKDKTTMSEMQTDRVERGVELYKAGIVKKLIMTGDDGANNGDEVDAMHDYAVKAGVPPEALGIDPHGYNTYISCDRAVHLYGITQAIVVSQRFHLSRIIYFCTHQGMQVQAVAADLREYPLIEKVWPQRIREWLARVKAVVSVKSARVGNVVVY